MDSPPAGSGRERAPAGRLHLRQQVIQIGKTGKCVPIQLHDRSPSAAALCELFRSQQNAIGHGVEPEVGPATLREYIPQHVPPLRAARVRVVHPLQQIAHGVRSQQVQQPFGVDGAALEFGHRPIQQHARLQRLTQCLLRRLVLRDIEAETTVLRCKECHERPVPGVGLAPEHAAVLQFGERLQIARARFNGAQLCPADARQIDHRYAVQRHLRHEPGHCALQPDGRTRAALNVAGAQCQQVGHRRPYQADGRFPLAVLVGPKHRCRRCGGVGVAGNRPAKQFGQTGQNGRCHATPSSICSAKRASTWPKLSQVPVESGARSGLCNAPLVVQSVAPSQPPMRKVLVKTMS